jgi:hypothetical protein
MDELNVPRSIRCSRQAEIEAEGQRGRPKAEVEMLNVE